MKINKKNQGIVACLGLLGLVSFGLFGSSLREGSARSQKSHPKGCMCPGHSNTVGQWTQWPAQPKAGASSKFWKAWGDGKAELSSYRASVPRYGQRRQAEVVLIYVTEPMNRSTWIKDDYVRGRQRVPVLKLNYSLKFNTGLYPYSVLTSVFSPADRWSSERFAPAKISLTAQEWCGHVFASVWPSQKSFLHQLNSYFASEGEGRKIVPTGKNTLYEDALMIQLRELDGPFHQGKTKWVGKVVPSLWRNRKQHRKLRPQRASITRKNITQKQRNVTEFTLQFASSGFRRTFTVEATGSRRLLGWTSTDGERVTLHKTMRLPYWNLSRNRDSVYRKKLGLH